MSHCPFTRVPHQNEAMQPHLGATDARLTNVVSDRMLVSCCRLRQHGGEAGPLSLSGHTVNAGIFANLADCRECPLSVINGQTVMGKNSPLSATPPMATVQGISPN